MKPSPSVTEEPGAEADLRGWRSLVHPPDLNHVDLLLARVKDLKGGVRASKRILAQWVFENIPVAWRDIRAEDVPSVGAIPFLAWAQSVGYPKLYESTKLTARDEKMGGEDDDDGRDLAGLCTRLLKLSEKGKA